MSTGRGIPAFGRNDGWTLAGDGSRMEKHRPVHFVQMWVAPDESGIDRAFSFGDRRRNFSTMPAGDHRLRPADHRGEAAITIANRYAALQRAAQPGQSIEIAGSAIICLFVPRGR